MLHKHCPSESTNGSQYRAVVTLTGAECSGGGPRLPGGVGGIGPQGGIRAVGGLSHFTSASLGMLVTRLFPCKKRVKGLTPGWHGPVTRFEYKL